MCQPLLAVAPHLFTTREWLLGTNATSDHRASWADVAVALRVDAEQLVRVHQVHGASALIAHGRTAAQPDADIIVTIDPELALAVGAADCVPLLVVDRRTGAVAAAHAGWRGLAARVPAATVAALGRAFGARGSDLLAAIGPSIGACCYEVGTDVKDRFTEADFTAEELARWFLRGPVESPGNPSMSGVAPKGRHDHWFFDAWAAAREQLVAEGLAGDQIFTAELCTASHAATFCSYRRDGGPTGRIAGAIRRLPPRP